MLKAWKSYWAFGKSGYKLVIFVLIPLITLINAFAFVNINTEMIVIALVLSFVILWIAEPMSDHWFMGGIYGKNKGALEFLQSSNYFSLLMKNVVLMDVIRRMVTYILVYALVCMVGYLYGAEREMKVNLYTACSFLPFLSMFVSQMEVFIGRHFEMWNQRYLVAIIGFIIEGFTLSGFLKLFVKSGIEKVWMINGVLFMLFVITSIGTVIYTKKKVRESYYDK